MTSKVSRNAKQCVTCEYWRGRSVEVDVYKRQNIVLGRSSATRKSIFSKPTLTEKLSANAPNLDVHIIPDTNGKNTTYRAKKARKRNGIVFSRCV